jgi:hypothetical protein
MKILVMFFIGIMLAPGFLRGQRVYDTLWTRTYGGGELDKGHAIELAYDSGYVIAGETRSFGPGPLAIYLIKTDSSGNVVWTQTYGGSQYDYALSVKETADSGYVLAGVTNSFGAGYRDLYLIKTSSIGDTIWTKTHGGPDNDVGAVVLQTQDGGYIVLGTTYSFSAGSGDVWLVKTDANGNAVWTQSYGGVDSDAGWDLQPTTDGGYIIAGQTRSFGAGDFDVYLIKTNSFGDTLWTRTYGGVGDDRGFSVCECWGGYLVAGYTASFGAGGEDMYLIGTDSVGNMLWSETYGGPLDERANSIREGHFAHILLGYTASFGTGGTDLYVLEINTYNGSIYWYGIYGGIADEEGTAMHLITTAGYEQYFVVTGYTESFGAGIEDVWLLKLIWMDGIDETTVDPYSRNIHIPTIISGPIQLPEGKEYKLYDSCGRKVNGQNPAPGVYFLEESSGYIHKVVKMR